MMPLTNKNKLSLMWGLLFLITMSFFIGFFAIGPDENALFKGVIQRKTATDFTERSKISKDRVVLVKNSQVTVNNCRLVYRGIAGQQIYLDLYLLDLDPQYAYRQSISMAAAMDGIRLGDSEYRLLSANEEKIRFKIRDLYKTL